MQVHRGQGNCAHPLPNGEAVGGVGADEEDREATNEAREANGTDGYQLIVSGQAAQHDKIGGKVRHLHQAHRHDVREEG